MNAKAVALDVSTPTDREIVVKRAFDAPRYLVFEAWTHPKHVQKWLLGPEGWSMPVCEIDLRVGGAWHYAYRNTTGDEMDIRGIYKEVKAPERLVTTESWGGNWADTLNTTTFDEKNGKTITTTTILYATKEARDAALKSGMKEGMAVTYNRLDSYLTSLAT